MRVLVTGGLGYIGSHVVKALMAEGHEVVTLDRALPGLSRPLHRGEQFVLADITQPLLSQVGVIGSADAVIHLAALIDAPQSVHLPEVYYRVNFMGTLNVLDLAVALGAENFVLASSAAVYGTGVTMPITEDQKTTNPENPYGGSKLFSERLIADVAYKRGLNWVALRFFNIIGCDPEVGVTPTGKGLFSRVVDVALGERPYLPVFGQGHPTRDGYCIRDFVSVRDVTRAVVGVTEGMKHTNLAGGIFNVGTGHGASVLEVVEAARLALNHPIPVRHEAPRVGEVPVSVASFSALRSAVGWVPIHSSNIAEALQQEYTTRRV